MRASLILFFAGTILAAQTFEVASVKVNTSDDGSASYPHLQDGRIQATNATMRMILQAAWGLSSVQVTGPAWIDSDRYDIEAESPAAIPDTEIEPMLQALLKDRFHLEAHLETRQQPVYNLVVMKSGPKFKPFDPDHRPTQPPRMAGAPSMMMSFKNTMDQLATSLAGPTSRPVINKTGLEGHYTYVLQFGRVDASNQTNGAPDIFGAVQQQLGLKLDSDKASIPTLIVDHADRVPSTN